MTTEATIQPVLVLTRWRGHELVALVTYYRQTGGAPLPTALLRDVVTLKRA